MVSFFCHDSNENYHVYLSQKKIKNSSTIVFYFILYLKKKNGGGGGLTFIHKEDTCKNK